jgi:hypothetical protein
MTPLPFLFVFLPAKTKTRTHSLSLSLTTIKCLSTSRFLSRVPAVAEVLQALVTSVKAMVKKNFSEAHVFEHYGMVHKKLQLL